MILAFSLLNLVDFAISFWTVNFFVRSHAMSLTAAGSAVGAIFLAAGIPGTLLGGYLMDWLGQRSVRWHVWSSMAVVIVSVLPALLFLFIDSAGCHWRAALGSRASVAGIPNACVGLRAGG